MKEDFQLRGIRPVEMERLKMWQSGEAMDAEVTLSIQDEIPSGPEAQQLGNKTTNAVLGAKKFVRARVRRKQEEKKEFRHWALPRSDLIGEPFDERAGMEEEDL